MKEFISKTSLSNAIEAFKINRNLFTLTDKMKGLSLNDDSSTSSTSSSSSHYYDTPSALEQFKASTNPNAITRTLMDRTKMPFINIPNKAKALKDCVVSTATFAAAQTNNFIMTLGFRFIPGQEERVFSNLRIPESLDSVQNLRDKLGFTLSKDSITNKARLKLEGMSNLSAIQSVFNTRVLVEAITYNSGYYARFLILVQIGVGCTIWYAFAPGDGINPPLYLNEIFNPIEDYELFFYHPDTHVHEGFNKMFVAVGSENGEIIPGLDNPEVTAALDHAFANDQPFIDVKLPKNDSSGVSVGVALGLAVAIILTLGYNIFK